jgi:hypothetical protein
MKINRQHGYDDGRQPRNSEESNAQHDQVDPTDRRFAFEIQNHKRAHCNTEEDQM